MIEETTIDNKVEELKKFINNKKHQKKSLTSAIKNFKNLYNKVIQDLVETKKDMQVRKFKTMRLSYGCIR